MNRHGIIILLTALFWLCSTLASQTPFLKPHHLFRGKEEYTVEVIYQSPKGWIWFGTDRGLFRYDGTNYSRFTTDDGLADNHVTALACNRDNTLWIGHKSGKLSLYNGNNFWPFRPEEGLGNIEITDIAPDSSGMILYSTLGEGIYRFDGRYLTNLNIDDGISDDYVYDIEVDNRGIIWLATDNGITRLENGKTDIISMKDGLNDNIVRVLKSTSDGKLWVGTEETGLTIYDTYSRKFSPVKGWNFGAVTGFTITLENDIWIATETEGLIQLKSANTENPLYHKITEQEGLISDKTTSILKDREENIWIGGRQGIIQALPPAFEFLNKSNGTPFEMAYAVTHDKYQNLWVSGESGLFVGKQDNTGQYFWIDLGEKINAKRENFISLYTDAKGLVWAGTYGGGTYRIDPITYAFTKFTAPHDLNDNNVISISGNDSLVWLSTLGGGVSCYVLKTGKFRKLSDPDLSTSYIYSAKTGSAGRTWIAGSLKYPGYIKNDSLFLIEKDSARFPQLYSIAIDSAGDPWFNTRDKGLLKISQSGTELFGVSDGISFDGIQSIIFDKLNNLLIISKSGFLFYKPGKGVLLELGENSGLSYQYPVLNSVYTDKDGNIWIGTEKGIIIYNPLYFKYIGQNPGVFLSVCNLFYNPIQKGKTRFRHNENNFTFGYTGIWFTNPEGLTYRYKLEGYDLEWIYSPRNQTLTYSQLPPGKYTFRVEVSLDNKTWHDSADSYYSFTVKPPFWKRWWFITLIVILIVSGVYIYIRSSILKLEKDKEKLEIEVAKRTEEISNKNRELEVQKAEIARRRDIAEEQRDQIEAQKDEIQSSIRYAHRIQTAVLPPKKELDKILTSYFILNKPRDIVSGDFYWAARDNSNIYFSVGDCTGHGVPGAFMSMLGISALNDIMKSLPFCKASIILDLLRDRIQSALHQGSERELTTYDGMDISLCVYNPETMVIQFAAAHNSLYMIRAGDFIIHPADKIDIGRYSAEKTEFSNHIIQCKKGDLIYLFSDGYADQFGGPKGRKYTSQRFRDFLLKIHQEKMDIQRRMLDDEIENWRGTLPQIDDILVMGIRIV